MKKTNFDNDLKKQLKNPTFAARFKQASDAWDLALQLVDLRQKMGLSQATLARKVKTSQQQICRPESPRYSGHSMRTKIAKEILDNGFGFPVRLAHVPLIEIRGEWVPKLNYNKLAEEVLRLLSRLARPLTGNEARFVRQHFNLTTTRFGALFGLSHVAVLNWEKKGDKATDMQWSTEKDLRLFIQARLSNDPAEVGRLYGELARNPKGGARGKPSALGPVEARHLVAA